MAEKSFITLGSGFQMTWGFMRSLENIHHIVYLCQYTIYSLTCYFVASNLAPEVIKLFSCSTELSLKF